MATQARQRQLATSTAVVRNALASGMPRPTREQAAAAIARSVTADHRLSPRLLGRQCLGSRRPKPLVQEEAGSARSSLIFGAMDR